MLVVFDSFTGNVKRFVDKLEIRNIQIAESLIIREPYVLITYTTGFGEVPKKVVQFLKENHHFMVGVAVSGNRNWGKKFGSAGDIISYQYAVPLLHKFEIAGNEKDVETVLERIMQI